VKEIDWKKQMLIVVAAGGQRSHGYRVEVVKLKAKGGTLTVSWKLHRPECDADCVKTFPATLALVPAHKGKVVFEQVK
jgi:PrcB C-terminal